MFDVVKVGIDRNRILLLWIKLSDRLWVHDISGEMWLGPSGVGNLRNRWWRNFLGFESLGEVVLHLDGRPISLILRFGSRRPRLRLVSV